MTRANASEVKVEVIIGNRRAYITLLSALDEGQEFFKLPLRIKTVPVKVSVWWTSKNKSFIIKKRGYHTYQQEDCFWENPQHSEYDHQILSGSELKKKKILEYFAVKFNVPVPK